MSNPVVTMNLSENNDGMVPVNPSTSFVQENTNPHPPPPTQLIRD